MNERTSEGITFSAHVVKITTMVDGGFRISMDISDADRDAAKALMDNVNRLVQVGIVPLGGMHGKGI